MKKRYFIISIIAIVIVSVFLIWACKHPYGGGLVLSLNGDWYMSESGGVGYKGNVSKETTNNYITKDKTKVMVFPLKDGNNYYRIPTLMQLTNGDLLAFADKRIGSVGDLPNKIEIVYKRSVDNGANWSAEQLVSPKCTSVNNSYGDGGFILDRKTGNIICMAASVNGFIKSTPDNPIRINLIISKDNGKTWGTPVDITYQIYGSSCKDAVRSKWAAAFVSSGNGVQLRNGRMLFVINVRESTTSTTAVSFKNYVMYSDDGGINWKVSKEPVENTGGGNEAKIVELNDGTLLMTIRPNSPYNRRIAKSTDNGETWSEAIVRTDLPSSASNGDIIYYTSTNNGWDKNRLITMFDTVPYSVSPPAKPYLFYSYDEGNTWGKFMIESGQAGYSSLAVLKDGSIGILAEIGGAWNGPIYFMRVNMKYITSDKDKGPFKLTASGN